MREKATPQQALSVLIGKRLSIWRRAATMLNVQFGNVLEENDGSRGEYALHTESPWRLLRKGRIFTGRDDLFEPRMPAKPGFDRGKWYKDGCPDNLMEALMRSVLKGYDKRTKSIVNAGRLFKVSKVRADETGDIEIHMTGGFCLEVFAQGTDAEYWRLLDRDKDRQYFLDANRCGQQSSPLVRLSRDGKQT